MPDVDAVVIALPPALHADAAIDALNRGRHAYIEKPLATSLADARRAYIEHAARMFALAGQSNGRLRANAVSVFERALAEDT